MLLIIFVKNIHLKNSFTNNRILKENIPQVEQVELSKIEDKYLFIMLINRTIWFIISFISCVIISNIEILDNYSIAIYISFIVLFIFIFSFTRISFQKKKYAFRDHDLIYSSGVIFTSTTIIPYNRIQHLAIHQSFISRIFDLSSIQFYTAGGSYTDISIKGLSKEDAEKWKEFVSAKIEKLKK